jgi:ribonucleotide reductase alpha subunit
MDLFSMTTQTIAQKGRRGALMLMLSVEHPDIMEFIESKQDLDRINYANISVKVTPEFMNAVKRDGEWITKFTRPETGETVTRTYRARDIMLKMAECAWLRTILAIVFAFDNATHNITYHRWIITSPNICQRHTERKCFPYAAQAKANAEMASSRLF